MRYYQASTIPPVGTTALVYAPEYCPEYYAVAILNQDDEWEINGDNEVDEYVIKYIKIDDINKNVDF